MHHEPREEPGSILPLIPNFPKVGRERVERLQLAGVRPLERELEIRQERVIGRDVGLSGAASGDRAQALRAARVGQEALAGLLLRAPLERRANRHPDKEAIGIGIGVPGARNAAP